MDSGHRSLSIGRTLPRHEPDLSSAHKAAVERALRWAWQEVCTRWPQLAATGREEQITDKLAFVLNEHAPNNRRRAPGIASFETVGRGQKVRNPQGRIEKAPDLVFRPPRYRGVRIRDDWGLFVECKIVSGPGSVGRYCTQGVVRFATGEYCARMPSGAMIAYVRDGSRLFPSLELRLKGRYLTRSHVVRPSNDMSDSKHIRSTLFLRCVDITMTHLWLQAEWA